MVFEKCQIIMITERNPQYIHLQILSERSFFLAISEYRIIRVEAEMESFTVQAVYEKGVLKPKKKLNLPEHSVVELRVRAARPGKQRTPFASLIGLWEDLSEKEAVDLEKSLARARQQPLR
jgi:predicted DNA-binding antitoxin AbrB/MazE fold protein